MKRLSLKKIRELAGEIDTARRGGFERLITSIPGITEYSQAFLCEELDLCGRFPVFRSVALMSVRGDTSDVAPEMLADVEAASELRPEAIVSTTLDPSVAFGIASEQATKAFWTKGMFQGALIESSPVLLRYDIELERVLLYVPALLSLIESQYSPEELAKVSYQARRENRRKQLSILFEEAKSEKEVIADVYGLDPVVIDGRSYDTRATADIVLRKPNLSFDDTYATMQQYNINLPETEARELVEDLLAFVR